MKKWFGGGSEPKPSKPMTIQDLEKLLAKRMTSTGDALFMKVGNHDFAVLSKDDYLKLQRILEHFTKMAKELADTQDS